MVERGYSEGRLLEGQRNHFSASEWSWRHLRLRLIIVV